MRHGWVGATSLQARIAIAPPRAGGASARFVGAAVVDALAVEIPALALLFGARACAFGLGLAEPYAILRRLLCLCGTLALFAILAQIDDVAHGHRPLRRRPTDAIA